MEIAELEQKLKQAKEDYRLLLKRGGFGSERGEALRKWKLLEAQLVAAKKATAPTPGDLFKP